MHRLPLYIKGLSSTRRIKYMRSSCAILVSTDHHTHHTSLGIHIYSYYSTPPLNPPCRNHIMLKCVTIHAVFLFYTAYAKCKTSPSAHITHDWPSALLLYIPARRRSTWLRGERRVGQMNANGIAMRRAHSFSRAECKDDILVEWCSHHHPGNPPHTFKCWNWVARIGNDTRRDDDDDV